MKRVSAVLGLGLFALFGTGSAVGAQSDVYPPRATAVTVDVDTVGPGGTFNVTLSGCFDGELVRFTFESAVSAVPCDLTTGPRALVSSTDRAGQSTASFTAPAVPGQFGGIVGLDGAPRVGDFVITVVNGEAMLPANLLKDTLQVQKKPLFDPATLIVAATAAMAAAAMVVFRPQLG